MKKNLVNLLSIISLWLFTSQAWGQVPSQCKDVMLQAFAWDSYTDTQWTNLTSQAEEISKSFNMMWVPQSGYCESGNNMAICHDISSINHLALALKPNLEP